MDWVIVTGVLSLGAILGWMGYVVFVGQSNLKTFTAIVGVFGGAVVAGIFQALAGTKAALPREVWFYPLGLLMGVAVCASIGGLQKARDRRTQELDQRLQADTIALQKDREEAIRRREQIKTLIVHHIQNKIGHGQHITMISFDTLRDDLGQPDLTDDYLGEIIQNYPEVLCHRSLSWGRRGVGLVGADLVE